MKRIVIVGAELAGLAAAKALRHSDAEVFVVDSANHNLLQPLLYQVATTVLSPAQIASPIRGLLESQRNTTVVLGGTLPYELPGLHADGIISRTQYPTIPPTVEYKLTARGAALRPVLIAVQRWSKTQELAVAPEPAEKKQQPGR